MKAIRGQSLAIFLVGSVLIHGTLAIAFLRSEVSSVAPVKTDHERIAVRIMVSEIVTPPLPEVSMAPPEASSVPRPATRPRTTPPTTPPPSPPIEPTPKVSTEIAMAPVSSPAPSRPDPALLDMSSERPTERNPTGIAAPAPATGASVSPVVDPLPAYVAAVRARVDATKRYPAMARRRSEEGLVLARLSIDSSGRLAEIEVERAGSMLLRRATREAVESAAPFSAPPNGPVVIEIPIRWRVQD